ncbi:MAG: hypothetical protein J3K34DRAFT_521515 [Monoraphidium minutum]|nr:MAG: hypothetical protein J3K34DRAFT_521515 [Monoraphidium minutum]
MLPSDASGGLISAWHEHLYALATPDGRVKTFDTGNNLELGLSGRLRSSLSQGTAAGSIHSGDLPNGHLADGLQCLAWLDGSEAKARSGNPASTSSLAVGTSAGAVRAYDSATGGVRWQAPGCIQGGVTCLAFAAGGGLLCSGRDGQVVCLDPGSGAVRRRFRGSKHPVSGAAASPDGTKLLLGSSTLALWDLEADARIAKFSGHTTAVRAVAFAPSGRHALSAAPSERSVAVWNTSGSRKAKKLGGVAVAALELAAPALSVCTCAAPGGAGGDGGFYAAAVTEGGEAVVWLCAPEGEAALVGTPAARVRVGGGGDAILAAALEEADGGVTLVVARGNSAKPTFERVPIAAPQPGAPRQPPPLELPPLSEGLLLRGGGDGAAAAAGGKAAARAAEKAARAAAAGGGAAANGPLQEVEMLGPDNDGDLPDEEDEEEGVFGDAGGGGGGGASDDEEDGDGGGETLGERVAALERQQGGGGGAGGGPEAADAAAAGAALLEGPVKADSLAVLLQQALRSGDRGLLERCLGLSDARVVRNSVRRLVPMDAAALLRACVERLQSRPARGQQLAGWIRAVLLHHTAYLMAAPGAQPVLTSLYQTIEARLSMQRAVVSLAGRLDLLLAQSAAPDDDGGPPGGAAAPRVVYEESGSEDGGGEVEVEDAFAPRGLGSDEDEDSDGGGSDDEDEDGSGSGSGSDEDMEEGEEEEEDDE